MNPNKIEEHNSSSLQIENPDTTSDQSAEQAEDELTEDELIAKIIYLFNQNLTLAQIASILKIEINFLFSLTKLLKQHHMHKLQSKYELELTVPSVKSILSQYSLVINDEVIRNLPKNKILSMDYLRSKTKLSDQKLRNLYRTELLLQINLLLLLEYSSQQVADLVGYTVENINRIRRWYSLPNQNFSVYDLEIPINAELLGEELELTERRTYDIFKFELLKELNSKLIAGLDIKAAGREIGVSYDKARKWVKQYNLPNTESYPGFSPPEELYDHRWAIVQEGKLQQDEGTYLRSIQIGGEVGVIREDGEVILAKELVGLTSKELKAMGRFVMYNEKFQQVLTHIESVDEVEVEGVYKVESTERNYAILGPESRLIAYDEMGLIKILASELKGQSVLVARSLQDLPSFMPTFFDLFYGLEVPLRMAMTEETASQIKIRLKKQFGSSKGGCKALEINYRNFIEFRYLHHQDLVNLYNTFSFPDIKSIDFLKNVERLGIKGKKALIENPLVTPELFYICGLIASDGYTLDQILNRKSTTGFNNKVLELVDNYIEILKSIFPERHVTLRDPRPPEQVTYEAVTYNYALVRIINNLTVKGIDVNSQNAYLQILRLPIEIVGAFVRGFFDGDGHVAWGAQMLSIGIFNELRAKNFQLLLKRISITYSVKYSEGWSTPPRAEKPVWSEKWDVRISGKLDIMRFIDIVGSHHPEKIEKFNSLKIRLESQNNLSTQSSLAPKICHKLVRSIRQQLNITQKELDKEVGMRNLTWQIENNYSRTSKENIMKMIEYFESKDSTKSFDELKELKGVMSNDYLLTKPVIEKISEKQKIIKIITRNSLLIDNGLIVDRCNNNDS